jgi:hypothetical protein
MSASPPIPRVQRSLGTARCASSTRECGYSEEACGGAGRCQKGGTAGADRVDEPAGVDSEERKGEEVGTKQEAEYLIIETKLGLDLHAERTSQECGKGAARLEGHNADQR